MSSYLIKELILISSLYVYIYLYFMSFILVIRGEDWFIIWIGLEINMIRFIIIIYKRYIQESVEVRMKYFFIQSLGSALFLRIFYINKEWLGELMCSVLGYKIGVAPFYIWLVSVCNSLEWLSLFILLTLQKIIPLILINFFIGWICWLFVILRLVIGVIGAFGQKFLKILIVYSSIHHLGWLILCSEYSDMLWILYLFMYMLIIICIVIILIKNEIIYLFCIDEWKRKMWFAFGILRIGGIPPFLGFFLKWISFIYIIKMRILYIFFIILLAVVIFYVYFRVVFDVFIYLNCGRFCDTYIGEKFYVYIIDVINVIGLMIGLGIIIFIYIY